MNFDCLNNFLQKSISTTKDFSFIGNFINELKETLTKKKSYELSKTLPWHTILNFAKYDGNFAVCIDYSNKKIYYIPKENIIGTMPEPGEILKCNSPR